MIVVRKRKVDQIMNFCFEYIFAPACLVVAALMILIAVFDLWDHLVKYFQ